MTAHTWGWRKRRGGGHPEAGDGHSHLGMTAPKLETAAHTWGWPPKRGMGGLSMWALIAHLMLLYLCHAMWAGVIRLGRRGQFGDARMVEGFQAITMLILAAGRAAVSGYLAVRARLPELQHLWQWVDGIQTSPESRRGCEIGPTPSSTSAKCGCRIRTATSTDYMGAIFGRRRAFAVGAIFRGILRRCAFPL